MAWNLALKDPGVRWSDDWNFPTHNLANPGWLGRIHRGTPWPYDQPRTLISCCVSAGATDGLDGMRP